MKVVNLSGFTVLCFWFDSLHVKRNGINCLVINVENTSLLNSE